MSKIVLPLLLVAATLRAGDAPIAFVPKDAPPPGRVIVELQPFAKMQELRADLATIDTRAGKTALPALRFEYRHVMYGAALELADAAAVEEVRRLPYVRAVHPDLTVKMFGEPATQAATVDATARVNATSLGTRGEGIRIGIIDTGIDYNHPSLGGGFGPGFKVAGGWDFVGADGDPMDENGHGTHVAGIIAADSASLGGVAPGAKLFAYRVLDALGFGSQANVLAAIERSIDPNQDGKSNDHLDVLNLSLGSIGTANDLPSQAVDRAVAAGVIVVVAAGNEGAFASVRSPGTARNAITVGAITDAGVVTEFSSRGPTPGQLELKPDVVAPGFEILSARLGGGEIAYSGTSMSAPHVAGVAALLKKLHPDWTPAIVKSALVTSAAPLGAPVFARAAGRVDAAAASAQTTFLGGGGVSFGLVPGKSGTSTITRSVTLTNRGTAARTFDVVATGMPAGVTIAANPAAVQLEPGASQVVQLRLDAANETLAFPADYSFGGAIEFRGGAETLKLPWLIVRAGRYTVQFEGGGENLRGITADTKFGALNYDVDRAEIFGVTGTKWDLLMSSYERDTNGRPKAVQLVVKEDREMTGDDFLILHKTDASLQLHQDARDAFGARLKRRDTADSYYLTLLAIDYTKGAQEVEMAYLTQQESALYVSPLSPAFVVSPVEWSFDMKRHEAYNVQHPPMHGLTESKILTAGRGDYTRARLRFNDKRTPDYVFSGCPSIGIHESGPYLDMHNLPCPAHFISEALELDYYTTSESGTVASGTVFGTGDMVLPTLRGIDGAIVSAEFSPSPASYRLHDGDFAVVGGQALFPLTFFGTNGGTPPAMLFIRTGLTGALGDWQWKTSVGTTWTQKAADGHLIASGTVDFLQGSGPMPEWDSTFTAVREGLEIAGQPSRGEIEVHFGTSYVDYRAPSLTSFRIVDSHGRIGETMPLNDAIALEFSAADWNFEFNTATLPLKPESTRVWYRPSGTAEWIAAQPVLTGSDDGTFYTLGHVPMGEIYRADLANAAKAAGAVDVRVEVEDANGNRMRWTQSPAFVVSAAKGRALRFSR